MHGNLEPDERVLGDRKEYDRIKKEKKDENKKKIND